MVFNIPLLRIQVGAFGFGCASIVALVLSFVCGVGGAQASALSVVASIKPVHSLVARVMDGVGAPVLLLKGASSPHHMTIKPSQAAALANADLIVMVGGGMAAGLDKAVAGVAPNVAVLRLSDVPGVRRLAAREAGDWAGEPDHHAHHDDHDEHRADHHADHHADRDHHDHGDFDPHLWLSPANAKAFVGTFAAKLAALDPANADRYAENARQTGLAIDEAQRDVTAALAGVPRRGYLVYHDAYGYFEQAFGLHPIGGVVAGVERAPGAKRILKLRQRMKGADVRCLFTETPQVPALANTLVRDTDVKLGVMDPLGRALPPGPDLYGTLLRDLAANYGACMTGAQ